MSRTKNKAHDFREVGDYKAAIKLLRRFAPEKFGSKKIDLRHIKKISDIKPNARATIREYTRLLRPLTVYGFKAQKISDRATLESKYRAVYGVTEIPKGLQRFPQPVNRDGEVLKTKIKQYEYIHQTTGEVFDFDMATVQVSPGVRVARLHFADMGLEWDDLTGADLLQTLEDIWETYEPYGVAVQAGAHIVKSEGMPQLFYSAHDLAHKMQRLQGRYGADNTGHHFIDWMQGLDLYFKDKNQPIIPYLKDEQARWKKRNALATKLKNLRRRRADAEKSIADKQKTIRELTRRKSVSKKERAIIQREGEKLIYKKQKTINDIQKQIDRLAVELYTTD